MDKNLALIRLSESDRVAYGKQVFAQQSTPQKVFSAVWAVESEVNNGGFSQYFQNFSCETASYVAHAFEIIGAPKTADICRRAILTAFPSGVPAESEEIRTAAEDFSPDIEGALGELDQEFFAYPHNLTELLFAYVSDHPEEFGSIG